MSRLRTPLRWVLGLGMIVIGVLHFAAPDPFLSIMPPWVPWPLAMVLLSGAIEIALGIALQIPNTRQVAAWGLIALYFAVFPANVHMATEGITPAWLDPIDPWMAWARLPFQAVLIGWAWWYTRPEPGDALAPA